MEDDDLEIAGNAEDWAAICCDVVIEDRMEMMSGSMVSEPQHEYTGSPVYRDNLLLRETFGLTVAAVKYMDRRGLQRRWLIDQFERSSSSPGASSKEAQNAESLKDFVHKLKIALKEADEAEYWYYVIIATNDNSADSDIIGRIQRVMRILNKIIGTSKKRLLDRKANEANKPNKKSEAPDRNRRHQLINTSANQLIEQWQI